MDYYYSECCGALPDGNMEETHGDMLGVCSECREWAPFFDDDDYVDWEDQAEYILEHMEQK